jgi:choice-of-anchor C domain-containing protein
VSAEGGGGQQSAIIRLDIPPYPCRKCVLHTHRSRAVAALARGAVAAAGSARAATVVPPAFSDGSFEAPTAPAGSFTTIGLGQSIGPWTVTRGYVDQIGAGFWAAAGGDQSVGLEGGVPGAVSQTFATIPGTVCTVAYSLAGSGDAGRAVKTGSVRIDGRDVQVFSFDAKRTHLDMHDETDQVIFLATGPSTTLAFASTTSSARDRSSTTSGCSLTAERGCARLDRRCRESPRVLMRCVGVSGPPSNAADPRTLNSARVPLAGGCGFAYFEPATSREPTGRAFPGSRRRTCSRRRKT